MSARASASRGRPISRTAKAWSAWASASTTTRTTTTTQGQTYGYSATTAYVQTSNSGITNNSDQRPVPTSRAATNPIQQPTGNTLGVNANLGAKMVYYSPIIKVPYSERTSLDVQYQIGNTILVDLGYINNHQVHLSYSNTVDAIPLLPYLSHSPVLRHQSQPTC